MLRDEGEIQKAHDILKQLLMDRDLPPLILTVRDQLMLSAAADVLCWVLGHDHNLRFGENLERIYGRLEKLQGPVMRAASAIRLDGKKAN